MVTAGEGVAAARAAAQQGIAAAAAGVKQMHNDFRAKVLTPRLNDHYAQFYARDFEVAERGSVDAALQDAIRHDNWKGVVERPATVAWERAQRFARAYPHWEEGRGSRLVALLERVRGQAQRQHAAQMIAAHRQGQQPHEAAQAPSAAVQHEAVQTREKGREGYGY
jgi:hypothetical protein